MGGGEADKRERPFLPCYLRHRVQARLGRKRGSQQRSYSEAFYVSKGCGCGLGSLEPKNSADDLIQLRSRGPCRRADSLEGDAGGAAHGPATGRRSILIQCEHLGEADACMPGSKLLEARLAQRRVAGRCDSGSSQTFAHTAPTAAMPITSHGASSPWNSMSA
jgi:hypothetical protein